MIMQFFTITVSYLLLIVSGALQAAQPDQRTFGTPELAVEALVKALGNNDEKELVAIFGKEGRAVTSSGDTVDDRNKREKFLRGYEIMHRIEMVGDTEAILVVGENNWPFPIPVEKIGGSWFFNTVRGREEILWRRIGENEYNAIQTCLAIVDAQREYAAEDRDGDGLLEYAPKFFSDTGTKDGLYWRVLPGEAVSPLGPLVAEAQAKGYRKGTKPVPYEGYFYRMLEAQGPFARGGAYSYRVNGKLLGGFAVVAYPARYAVSGVKTFTVNLDGIVYQKDLGPKTAESAQGMKEFNPDSTWEKTQ
jgi:hypothetical protein